LNQNEWLERRLYLCYVALKDNNSLQPLAPCVKRHIMLNATEELKLDGYRAIGFKSRGKVYLRSRNDNDFAGKYTAIAKALEHLPDETIVDGEVVAFDASGRPSFNRLQNWARSDQAIFFYVFDLLMPQRA
jgi:ATP-dependent DNA ligase